MSIYQLMSSEYVLMNKEVDWKRVHSSYQHEAETDENVAMHVKRIYKIFESKAGRVVA